MGLVVIARMRQLKGCRHELVRGDHAVECRLVRGMVVGDRRAAETFGEFAAVKRRDLLVFPCLFCQGERNQIVQRVAKTQIKPLSPFCLNGNRSASLMNPLHQE